MGQERMLNRLEARAKQLQFSMVTRETWKPSSIEGLIDSAITIVYFRVGYTYCYPMVLPHRFRLASVVNGLEMQGRKPPAIQPQCEHCLRFGVKQAPRSLVNILAYGFLCLP